MIPGEHEFTLNIRQAQINDIPFIVQLIQELAEMEKVSSPLNKTYVEYYLSQPNCYILVAEAGDQSIGLLSYMMKPDLFHGSDTCTISELVVSKGFRGRGVGSALLDHLMRQLISIGCVEISVSTLPDNQGAIQFYKRHGLVDEAVLLERHFN